MMAVAAAGASVEVADVEVQTSAHAAAVRGTAAVTVALAGGASAGAATEAGRALLSANVGTRSAVVMAALAQESAVEGAVDEVVVMSMYRDAAGGDGGVSAALQPRSRTSVGRATLPPPFSSMRG